MRVFVSADMEGVAGIARDEQTDPASPLHPASRHQYVDVYNLFLVLVDLAMAAV